LVKGRVDRDRAGKGRSEMFKPKLSSTAWRLGVPALVAGAGMVAGSLGIVTFNDDGNAAYFPWAALLFASAGVLAVFVVFDVVAGHAAPAKRRKYGWVNAVLGADGRVSTSRVQMFLWTLAISAALLYLSGVAIFSVGHDDGVLENTDWNDYLILLGGPFAAGVLAKFAVVTKIGEGTLQKTVLPTASGDVAASATAPVTDAAPAAADAVTNDAGELDLVDCQYLIFNVVALLYVFGTFVSRIIDKSVTDVSIKYSLPAVPAVLLGLTSAAAATYVANKAALKNPPLISTLNPTPPVSGKPVDISGVNLVPGGSDQATVADLTLVIVRGVDPSTTQSVLPVTNPTPTRVTCTMPPGLGGTSVDIQVITTANVATPPFRTSVA
jgi:hypothetical protein